MLFATFESELSEARTSTSLFSGEEGRLPNVMARPYTVFSTCTPFIDPPATAPASLEVDLQPHKAKDCGLAYLPRRGTFTIHGGHKEWAGSVKNTLRCGPDTFPAFKSCSLRKIKFVPSMLAGRRFRSVRHGATRQDRNLRLPDD